MTVSNWQRHAACATADPDLFLAETGHALREARAVCTACPVTAACLTAALAEERGTPAAGRAGIRGGLTPEQRAELAGPATEPCPEAPAAETRPRKRAAGPVVCGTRGGYQKHRRNGEQACDLCRYANAAADRRLRTTGSTVRPADLAPAA
jgi:hypothetical protein